MDWLPGASVTVEPARSDMARWAGGGSSGRRWRQVPARLDPSGGFGDRSAERVHAPGDLGVGHERGLPGGQVAGEGGGGNFSRSRKRKPSLGGRIGGCGALAGKPARRYFLVCFVQRIADRGTSWLSCAPSGALKVPRHVPGPGRLAGVPVDRAAAVPAGPAVPARGNDPGQPLCDPGRTAGLDPENDIEVTVDGRILTIRAERFQQDKGRIARSSATDRSPARSGSPPRSIPRTSPPGTTRESWR